MTADRLSRQLEFLVAADGLKRVSRANVLMDGSRRENTAEHSWHIALWSLVFAERIPPEDRAGVLLTSLVHDLVEVHAGDHPIHETHDPARIAAREAEAAERLFPLLPPDQAEPFHAAWQDYDTQATAAARATRCLDLAQPAFQELANPAQTPLDREILTAILTTGRGAELADTWPEVHARAMALLECRQPPSDADLDARLRFLAEADALKTVLRGTTLFDGSRRENSAEHSWHLALFAFVLAEHAVRPVDPHRCARMLILHDLVEIDAGDAPIHGNHDPAEQEARERAAADRLFGLLPPDTGPVLRALWEEFEAAETPDAVFAKSVDRVQPVLANLQSGGGTWIDYKVTRSQLEERVGAKVRRGAPALWTALTPGIDAWFGAAGR